MPRAPKLTDPKNIARLAKALTSEQWDWLAKPSSKSYADGWRIGTEIRLLGEQHAPNLHGFSARKNALLEYRRESARRRRK